jgi:Holliday junction resolvase
LGGRRSRNKGKSGEREFAAFLNAHGASDAKRGVQYQGGPNSPDVQVTCRAHWEVKRTEALSLYPALEQAANDAAEGKTPIVAHRRNHKDWVVAMRAEDFFQLLASLRVRSKFFTDLS